MVFKVMHAGSVSNVRGINPEGNCEDEYTDRVKISIYFVLF